MFLLNGIVAVPEANENPSLQEADTGPARHRRNLGTRIARAQRRTPHAAVREDNEGEDEGMYMHGIYLVFLGRVCVSPLSFKSR